MASNPLLTRDEVLGGLPARRASTLVYLIESRTAQLVARARHTMTPFRSEDAAHERELAFIEAFALGRDPPLRPTIQDLERHAAQWADLVPENRRLRAAMAHQVGQKYRFSAADVPALRSALGLDDPGVRAEYERLYGKPLDAMYAPRQTPMARIRWTRTALAAWLESLPPFWIVYALTLTETVGAGILALPIALATIGPLAGIALLIAFGVVNVITIAWMAEAAARTASMRYGGAYFGRFVNEYLGGAGSVLLTLALVVICATLLIAYAIGLAATVASATGIAAAIWVAVLFAIVGYMISRDSMSSTVASALGLGALNMALLGILALLGIAHLRTDNLTRVDIPGIGGTPFEVSFLGLIFGIILIAYFGHTSVGNCASLVLQRDPSARSLIRGAVAAQITAIVLYATWVLAINGAIEAHALEGFAGTVLDPLADIAGPAVLVVGLVFVVSAMGLGSIHMALGLVNVTRERIPRQSQPVVLLPRRAGQLVFTPRAGRETPPPRLVLTYLGLDGAQPRYRLDAQVAGRHHRVNHTSADPWDIADLPDLLPDHRASAIDLQVETVDAGDDHARIRITSASRMTFEGSWITPGIDLAALIDTEPATTRPDSDAALLRWMLRQGGADLAQVAAWAGQDEHWARLRMQELIDRGAVRETRRDQERVYRVVVARRRARTLPKALLEVDATSKGSTRFAGPVDAIRDNVARAGSVLLSGRGRPLLEFLPVVLVALATEWLVITDNASFTQVLNFGGVIAVPIFAGIFPCLLLQSSRRKGDLVPAGVSRFLGRPSLAVGIYALFLISILLHGLVLWQGTVERVAAIVTSVIMLVVTVLALRRGALDERTVVMVRDDRRPGGSAGLGIVSGGLPAPVDAWLDYGERVEQMRGATTEITDIASLRELSVTLPDSDAPDLKIWANRITPDGDIESLAARVHLMCSASERGADLRLAGGQSLLPRDGNGCGVTVGFDHPPSRKNAPANPGRRPRVDLDALLASGPKPDTQPEEGG